MTIEDEDRLGMVFGLRLKILYGRHFFDFTLTRSCANIQFRSLFQ